MSTLHVQLMLDPHLPRDLWNPIPVPVQVLNSDFELVGQLTVRGENSIWVPPGSYLVHAELPSGETVTAQTVVREDTPAVAVTLRPSQPPRKELAWQYFLGEVAKWEVASEAPPMPEAWLRLWLCEDGEWTVQQATLLQRDEKEYDETMFLYQVDFSEQPRALRFLQIGGPEVPWRLVSLPYSPYPIQILVQPSRTPTHLNGGLVVKVVTLDQMTEILSHYLRSGASTAAREVADDVLWEAFKYQSLPDPQHCLPQEAEQLLRDKVRNPYGAAVGGYYLLQTGEYDRLHDWPNNFANWMQWLPDAAVIHAWQLLYTGGENERARARERLLDAAGRGLPMHSEGLRLLIEGLELFVGETQMRKRITRALKRVVQAFMQVWSEGSLWAITQSVPNVPPNVPPFNRLVKVVSRLWRETQALVHRDAKALSALKQARKYAAAVNWNERLTTFYGSDPRTPSLQPVTGVPTDNDNCLQHLPTR